MEAQKDRATDERSSLCRAVVFAGLSGPSICAEGGRELLLLRALRRGGGHRGFGVSQSLCPSTSRLWEVPTAILPCPGRHFGDPVAPRLAQAGRLRAPRRWVTARLGFRCCSAALPREAAGPAGSRQARAAAVSQGTRSLGRQTHSPQPRAQEGVNIDQAGTFFLPVPSCPRLYVHAKHRNSFLFN